MTDLVIPDFALVVLVGASGSGKSSFAARHFRATEIVSSDQCRAMVCDDAAEQEASADAFELVMAIAAKRLARRRLTVIDATSTRAESRKQLLALARRYHAPAAAIVFDLPEAVCQARNQARPGRQAPAAVVRDQVHRVHDALPAIARERFGTVHVLSSAEAVERAVLRRVKLRCDRRGEHGPFDLIGDVHGCRAELETLLDRLGYRPDADTVWRHPQGRRALLLGDLVDRGPDSPGVLRLVMAMVAAGTALAVPGNHDMKLARKLLGRDVKIAHGLAETLAQLDALPDAERQALADAARTFFEDLSSHLWLDDGRLVAAHAGLKSEMQGRSSGQIRSFALYGDTNGEIDDFGMPVRLDWAADYRGRALVVYGHTPVPQAEWVNNTICIDTGCVFGGALTALRYPERELVSVPAAQVYMAPSRPL